MLELTRFIHEFTTDSSLITIKVTILIHGISSLFTSDQTFIQYVYRYIIAC